MPDLFCKQLWKRRLLVIWLAFVICNLTNTFSKGVGVAWKGNFKYRYTPLSESSHYTISLLGKDLSWYLFSLIERSPKRISTFIKRQKAEWSEACFATAVVEAAAAQAAECPSPEPHSTGQQQAAQALTVSVSTCALPRFNLCVHYQDVS